MSRYSIEFGHVPKILRKFPGIMGKYRILDENLWGLKGLRNKNVFVLLNDESKPSQMGGQ